MNPSDDAASRLNPAEPRGEVVMKNGAVIPVTVEILQDGGYVAKAIDDSFDRWLRPWKYPDRPVWPTFVPLPRVAVLQAAPQRARRAARTARTRVRDAWSVLLGRESVYDYEAGDW